jgi:predicted Zn-ribbon and HTH transcriptional regulator
MDQEIILPKFKCKRCGHEWIPRNMKKPKQCPNCHSPYWDKEKWKGVKNV